MNEKTPPPVRWKTFLGYGTGDYALNLFWQGTSFYLFFFYANVVGIPNTVVGTIFLIASVWDAITDPTMGFIAERTRSRWGPYRPYLLFGAVPLGVSFALLFTLVTFENKFWEAAYYLGILLLFRSCYTVVSIPYSALGARVTRNFDARTKLSGVRMYFGFLGGISISFFAKQMQGTYSDAEAFAYMGVGAGFLAIFILYFCFHATTESANPINKIVANARVTDGISSIFSNKPFLLLIGGFVMVNVATTVIGQTSLFYFENQFGGRDIGNTAIVFVLAAPLVGIPFWATVALKFGKRNTWIVGSLVALLGLGLIYVDQSNSTFLTLAEISLTSVGLSAYAILFWSMLPDTIEYGEVHSNIHSESLLIGIASSFQKITIGISAFAVGLLLDYVGFEAGTSFSNGTSQGLKNIFTLVPFGALCGSIAIIYFYPITAKMHGQFVATLQKKVK
ncbi:MAG: MFS transporter [Kordiimonadaceae bacterium]|nr:MFS transporter [Kordiimonadaceae bacterium]